jgi:hypothetical protein
MSCFHGDPQRRELSAKQAAANVRAGSRTAKYCMRDCVRGWQAGASGCGAHLVIEVAIQAQDVRVAQVRLDLYLAPQLVLHVGLLQLRLEQHLGTRAPRPRARIVFNKAEAPMCAAPQRIRFRTSTKPVTPRALATVRPVGNVWARRQRGRAPRTFSATMNLLRFSRARYTLPNLPRPSGLPMSKSSSCHRRSVCGFGRGGGGPMLVPALDPALSPAPGPEPACCAPACCAPGAAPACGAAGRSAWFCGACCSGARAGPLLRPVRAALRSPLSPALPPAGHSAACLRSSDLLWPERGEMFSCVCVHVHPASAQTPGGGGRTGGVPNRWGARSCGPRLDHGVAGRHGRLARPCRRWRAPAGSSGLLALDRPLCVAALLSIRWELSWHVSCGRVGSSTQAGTGARPSAMAGCGAAPRCGCR